VVKDIADILDSKEPGVLRRVCAVKNSVGDAFNILSLLFSKVLVLHMLGRQ
jgi:acetolactate synthase small subunit